MTKHANAPVKTIITDPITQYIMFFWFTSTFIMMPTSVPNPIMITYNIKSGPSIMFIALYIVFYIIFLFMPRFIMHDLRFISFVQQNPVRIFRKYRL